MNVCTFKPKHSTGPNDPFVVGQRQLVAKTCTKCRKFKDASHFPRGYKNGHLVRGSRCVECVSDYNGSAHKLQLNKEWAENYRGTDKKRKRAQLAEDRAKPEVVQRKRDRKNEYRRQYMAATPGARQSQREYNQRPEVRKRRREYTAEYNKRPEVIQRKQETQRAYNDRNKEYHRRQSAQNNEKYKAIPCPNNRKPWTPDDDMVVMRPDLLLIERCYLLGRTSAAISSRRHLLRQRGLLL